MAKRNHVKIMIRKRDAEICANWILKEAIPRRAIRGDTLLGEGNCTRDMDSLQILAVILAESARPWGARRMTKRDIPKAAIYALESVLSRNGFTVTIADLRLRPKAIVRLVLAIRAATRRSRGRPRLTKAERSKRFSKEVYVIPRQIKRLGQQQKDEKSLELWGEELRKRGETILTTSLPLSGN